MSERYDDVYDADADPEFDVEAADDWDDEDVRRRQRRWKIIVAVVSAILILSLVAIPVLNAIDTARGSDTQDIPRDASTVVARRFTESVMVDRSVTRSTGWAIVSLRAEIEALVGSLQARDAADLDGADPSLARRSCARSLPDDAECFEAWLRRADGPDLLRISFAVGVVNGEARVIEIARLDAVASTDTTV